MSPARDVERSESDAKFFRCPVQPEQSLGRLRVGYRRLTATVQDASIEGFTLLIRARDVKRLSLGKTWVLDHDGARFRVHPQWFFNAPDGQIQVGLRRLGDLTAPPPVGRWWPLGKNALATEEASLSTVAFYGFLLVILLALALPGLGDQLGTASLISDAFQSILRTVGGKSGRAF